MTAFLALAMLIGSAWPAAAADPTAIATADEVKAAVAAMHKEMKPDQGFMWRPLLRGGAAVAALEIWRKPGRPAVHPAEAEYATVVSGSGTLVAGGTMTEPETSNPGLIQGGRIEGGESRKLAPGDVFLVPAGVPHWFGIEPGGELVLLGTKLAQPPR
jgi:mannose-6-phosphate isomerase-like protein (cupin superfamily)